MVAPQEGPQALPGVNYLSLTPAALLYLGQAQLPGVRVILQGLSPKLLLPNSPVLNRLLQPLAPPSISRLFL